MMTRIRSGLIRVLALFVWGMAASTYISSAGEISHYNPGVADIRDFFLPDAGFYSVIYNYGYTTDRLNDNDGNKVSSVTVGRGPAPGTTVNIDVDVNLYALIPAFIWVSQWNVAGGRYGAYIAPSFANSSLGASLATEGGAGRNASTSQFGVGDLFVQPVWLGWSPTNWDFAISYGFYAPVGKYDTQILNFPVIGPLTVESPDNIGYGFWTHQFQGAAAWYPWADKRMAVTGVVTYEINQKKEDFDITPGQNLTLNWGISQYLPLTKDKRFLLEIGPAGYNSWQITDDSGSDVRNPSARDEVHAVGGQLGVTYAPWNLAINLHGFYEYASKDRFQGAAFGINLIKKF